MVRNPEIVRSVRTPLVVFVFVVLVLSISFANAESCFELDLPLVFDTSSNPMPNPTNPKAHGIQVFLWNGVPHLVINTGNDLQLSDVSDPHNPTNIQDSDFGVLPFGDRDYNLYRFSVCDGCRYGTTDYDSAGSVLFDLGSGSSPAFGSFDHYTTAGVGRMTFKHDGQQYLVADGFGASCGSFASLHEFNGTGLADLPFLACLTGPAAGEFHPTGGTYVPGPGSDGFLYLSDGVASIHVFRLVDGPTLSVEYLGAPIQASHFKGEGWAVDLQTMLFAGVRGGVVRLYDIADPADPQLLSEWSVADALPAANLVAMVWPRLWVGWSASTDARSFDIENPTNPREIDRGFWADCHPWNSFSSSIGGDAEFTPDGLYLILSRFSVVERLMVDPACPGLVFSDGFECGFSSPWTDEFPPAIP